MLEKIEKLYKIVENVAGPLCLALTLRKIKLHQLKACREKLVEAIILLDEISTNLSH